MELRHLRYFVAVAEELHFRRAAERLHISQPPLSLQIGQLEREVGTALLVRNRRGVALTPAGREFVDHARAVLAAVESGRHAALRTAAGDVGSVRVGFTQSALLLEFVQATITDFRAAHPGVHVVLAEMDSTAQIAELDRRRLDIGVLHRPPGPILPSVALVRLCADELVVAVPRDHPLATRHELAVRDLDGEPLLCTPRDSGSHLWQHVTGLCWAAGFQPSVVQEAASLSTLVVLVATGLGVAVLPAGARRLHVPGVAYVPLEASASAEISLATHRGSPDPLRDAFVELLVVQGI